MTLSVMIARVEEGAGPDRELDCLVGAAVDIQIDGVMTPWKQLVEQFGIAWAVDAAERYNSVFRTDLPRYTASLDAVLSLIEQKLPGMSWEVRRSGFGSPCQAMIWNPMKAPPVSTLARMDAKSPARALLAATLRALSALEDSKAGLADANSNGDRP